MPRMLRRAVVLGATASVAHKAGEASAQKQADAQTAEAQQATPADPTPPPPAEADYMAELEQLAKLRDDGIITAEDYEAKKKQILGI